MQAFRTLTRQDRPARAKDVLAHIELPLWVSWVGIPMVGAVGVCMANLWFGVPCVLGAASIPLIFVLTLIAASSTALTGITPIGRCRRSRSSSSARSTRSTRRPT